MNPIEFKEMTGILKKPESMTDEECSSLPVHINDNEGVCTSCWELFSEDIKEIIKTKKIYISVWSGKTQPPILPSVLNPFEVKENE